MSASERIKELKIDSTLWTDPKRIINLQGFDPRKLSIYTELNSISNIPDASSKDLIEVYEVRYDNGGFYLVINDIKGYFNIDNKSLIEKDNKFYLELALNCCLFEPYEIKL